MTKIRFVHTPPGPRGRIAKPWTYRHQCDVFPNLMANRHLTVATRVILRETYFSKRGRIQAKPERVRILHLSLVPKLSLGTKPCERQRTFASTRTAFLLSEFCILHFLVVLLTPRCPLKSCLSPPRHRRSANLLWPSIVQFH